MRSAVSDAPSALVLAAGLGTRMRPLTDRLAKPLLTLDGRTLLDRALDRLAEAGVGRVVVNAHWQADRLEAHLASRREGPETVVLREDTLLQAGGTAVAALRRGLLAPDRPILIVNGDSVWYDGPAPALRRLIDGFGALDADGLLMLARTAAVHAEVARGDFMLDPSGVLRRPEPAEVSPFLYAGLQIVSPWLFRDPPGGGAIGLNPFWDRALAAGRLQGLVHDGDWFHLSTPADLAAAEQVLAARVSGNGI